MIFISLQSDLGQLVSAIHIFSTLTLIYKLSFYFYMIRGSTRLISRCHVMIYKGVWGTFCLKTGAVHLYSTVILTKSICSFFLHHYCQETIKKFDLSHYFPFFSVLFLSIKFKTGNHRTFCPLQYRFSGFALISHL